MLGTIARNHRFVKKRERKIACHHRFVKKYQRRVKCRDAEEEGAAKRGKRGDMNTTLYQDQELTHTIIAAAIEVHKNLGPGLLEMA